MGLRQATFTIELTATRSLIKVDYIRKPRTAGAWSILSADPVLPWSLPESASAIRRAHHHCLISQSRPSTLFFISSVIAAKRWLAQINRYQKMLCYCHAFLEARPPSHNLHYEVTATIGIAIRVICVKHGSDNACIPYVVGTKLEHMTPHHIINSRFAQHKVPATAVRNTAQIL